MSKLVWTENGHVVPTLCEELTRYRRARKVLVLPETAAPATLYFLARARPGSGHALYLSIDGVPAGSIDPDPSGAFYWYQVEVSPHLLHPGENRFEFWTGSSAMDSWALGLEAGHRDPHSSLTDDGGLTWRSQHMGYLNVLRGEYIVRIRLAEGQDPPPPEMAWEEPTNPRLESLRRLLPPAAIEPGRLLDRVRALTGWLSASWEHTNSSRGLVYSPWDAETILSWGGSQQGHAGHRPIAMCVHYAVAFVSSCQALGIPARCAVLADEINSPGGHFVAEVWFPEYDKWVMVDPNLDSIFWRDGQPMSLAEIQQEHEGLAPFVEWGPGIAFQRRNPRIGIWLEEAYLNGRCFQHRGIWARADLLSHPEFSPPGHGSTAYCETGIVWEERERARGLGMFPYFGTQVYFEAPPQAR